MKVYGYEITEIELAIGAILLPMIYSMIKTFLRFLMCQTEATRKILTFFTNLSSEKNLFWFSKFLFLVIYITLFVFQSHFSFFFIDYNEQKFELIGIYGFIIGILSMYGIYIGFLQFIVSDSEKVKYLGKSKVKYLTDTSKSYQITQTPSFFMILFLAVITPLLISKTSGELQQSCIYIWQTSITMLLWIYLFLIGMSLQIIRILFLIKDKTDRGLEWNIERSISNKYYELFRKVYQSNFDYESIQNFFKYLKFDILRIETNSMGLFLAKVFSEIDMNLGSEYGEFKSVRLEKRGLGRYEKYLYDGYKIFIKQKWKLLSSIKEEIDWVHYADLIEDDIRTITYLVNETPKLIKKKDNNLFHRRDEQIDNVHNYLFDQLIERAISEPGGMEILYQKIQESSKKLKFVLMINENTDILEYYRDVDKHKWKILVEKYLFSETQFELPSFSRYDNKELYSQAIFNYLISYYADLDQLITDNEQLGKLIQSMDREHRVAYSLYQLFYPTRDAWDSNTIFFKNEIEKEFIWLEGSEGDTLFYSSAKIVSGTHIKHRVTFKVLKTIYDDRDEIISDMSYFSQFDYSQISPLKILLVQSVLGSNKWYSNKFIIPEHQSEENLRALQNICIDFLHAIEKLPELLNFEELTDTLDFLIEEISFGKYTISHNLGIIGFLHYEFVLLYRKGVSTHEVFLEFVTYGEGEDATISFWYNSIFTFFTLKLIDDNYQAYFDNEKFLNAYKKKAMEVLDMLDITLDEYLESIHRKLRCLSYGKVGKGRLRQISIKLEKILFD